MRLSRPARAAAGALLLAAVAILAAKGLVPAFNNSKGDFANYYTASKLVVQGRALHPAYDDFSWFQRQMDRVGIRNQVGGFIPHPPPTALVFLPLTLWGPVVAKNLWMLVNLALLAVCITLLSRIAQLDWIIAALIVFASGYGLLNNFLFGQLYLLLTASILTAVRLHQVGRPIAAGIALGLLIPVKYFGVFFAAYFALRGKWRIPIAAAATSLAVVVLSLALIDPQTWRVFLLETLPRHLQGEIQDPYAVAFQSWNSMFRRLFLFEATLSPSPLLDSPMLAAGGRSLATLSLLAGAVFVGHRIRSKDCSASGGGIPQRDRELFQLGWIPLAMLLLSPGGATYHFLMLSLSGACFISLLLAQGRPWHAGALWLLLAAVSLPHYMKLMPLAQGWTIPLAYSRLWLLLLLACFTAWVFRGSICWSLKKPAVALAALLVLSLSALSGFAASRQPRDDGARRLPISNPGYLRNLGLIAGHPDAVEGRLVFEYCELLSNRYAIYTGQGRRWTPEQGRNFFSPSLKADGRLLAESTDPAGAGIWLSPGPGRPARRIAAGAQPRWHPTRDAFAYVLDGEIWLYDLATGRRRLAAEDAAEESAPAWSPRGDAVYYAAQPESNRSALMRVAWPQDEDGAALTSPAAGTTSSAPSLEQGTVFSSDVTPSAQTLLQGGRIESPSLSPDGRWIVFTRTLDANSDIWAMDLHSRRLTRLTTHPSIDRDPAWDAANSRIVFVSDRDRGLGCTTLYWIPLPETMR